MGGIVGAITSMFKSPKLVEPVNTGPDPEMVRAQREQEERIEAREAASQKKLRHAREPAAVAEQGPY